MPGNQPPPAPEPLVRAREWVTTSTDPSFVINVHPAAEDRYISLELHRHGVWEEPLHLRLREVLEGVDPQSNATLLDIGANIGFHSLAAAAAGFKAVAIEPLPSSVALLRKSVQANGVSHLVTIVPRVATFNASLSHASPVCLHTSSINKGHTFVRPADALNPLAEAPHAALLRLVRHRVHRALGRVQAPPGDGPEEEMVVDVHQERHFGKDCIPAVAATVDSMFAGDQSQARPGALPLSDRIGSSGEDVMVVKIDVEGYELFVLRGMQVLLSGASSPCYIFVEVFPQLLSMHNTSAQELFSFLRMRGYVLHTLGGDKHEAALAAVAEGAAKEKETDGADTSEPFEHHLPRNGRGDSERWMHRELELDDTGFLGGRYHPLGVEWLEQPHSLAPPGNMIIAEFRHSNLESCLARFAVPRNSSVPTWHQDERRRDLQGRGWDTGREGMESISHNYSPASGVAT